MNLPEGWPTDEMLEEGREAMRDDGFDSDTAGETDLKDIFIRMYEAAPTPPAQEDEPVYLCRRPDEDHWVEIEEKDVEFHERLGWIVRPLYARPNNDKLRKAAQSLVALSDRWGTQMPYGIKVGIENLRAALEK